MIRLGLWDPDMNLTRKTQVTPVGSSTGFREKFVRERNQMELKRWETRHWTLETRHYVLVKPRHSILRISYLNNHPHAYFQSHGAQCSHITAISKDAKVDRLKGTHHVWPGATAGNPSSPQDCPPRAHLWLGCVPHSPTCSLPFG